MVSVIETSQSASRTYAPYPVSVNEYITFKTQGFLVVRDLVPPEDVAELNAHMDRLLAGTEQIPGVPLPPAHLSPEEKLNYYQRVHMPHRVSDIHERFLLHPRTLDVLEALIGPDVLALQTMLFFKQPGQPGQGYHQDSYYITSLPGTLCGAWLALTQATEENGCMWFSVGSQNEPIYPDDDGGNNNGDRVLGDLQPIRNASHPDNEKNTLSRIAAKYTEVKVEAEPGDVVFFGGHVLHRSLQNRSKTQSRRSFVGHYCNARSLVPWNHGMPYEGDSGNYLHILARGTTHLPYAQPRFGTPCAANAPDLYGARAPRSKADSMMPDGNGLMILTAHPDNKRDED
jgi:chlorinating enzyme